MSLVVSMAWPIELGCSRERLQKRLDDLRMRSQGENRRLSSRVDLYNGVVMNMRVDEDWFSMSR